MIRGVTSKLLTVAIIYLLCSLPFTETEYIGIKFIAVVLIAFGALVAGGAEGRLPKWYAILKALLTPLLGVLVVAARKNRELLA